VLLLLLTGSSLLLAAAVLGQFWSWPIWERVAGLLSEDPAIVLGLLGTLLLATAVVARRRPRGNAGHARVAA
jgi:hypothetical protein